MLLMGAAYAQAPPAALGTNAILVASAAGSSSVVLSDSAGWTAVSNSSFLHVAAGSTSGTGSTVVAFTYDAFTGTGTRSGSLTVAGLTVTVTQTGTNYIGPGGPTALVSSGLSGPFGVAVDGSGNVYIADTGNSAIKEWNASSQQVTTLVSSGLSGPYGLAVDSAGNVYIADTGSNSVKEFNASNQQVTTLVSSGLVSPVGVAVDGSGNVYIASNGNNAIKEYNPSTRQVTTLISTGLANIQGVAVDAAGNVYIADSGNSAIKEWNVSTQTVTTLGTVNFPSGVAVDGSGNVYATTNGTSVVEWSPSTQQLTTLVSGLNNPIGVAVDGSGNLYTGDAGNSSIGEIPFAFVGPATGLSVSFAAGTDSLLPVVPATQSLIGVFAPTSDQSWLTLGSISGGVVGFSFTQNNTASARTANITILGQQIPITQQAPPIPPAFTCSNNAPPPEVNVAYTTTCTATSGTGTPPFTWSIASGGLPAGVTSSTTATSIILTGAATVAGTAAYTIQLNDSTGDVATQAFSGTIAPAATFSCSNNNVPTQTGAPYTTTCTVTSGTGVSPFTLSIGAGALPGGITSSTTAASITLTGPAAVSGPAAYTIQLSDQFGVTATEAFSGTIAGIMVANWSFSNGSNLGADSSGSGYNLVQEGSGPITFDPTALGGQGAAVFNGSDYFDFGGVFPALLPTGNSSYTIAVWINPGIVSNPPGVGFGMIGWGAYGNVDQTNAFRTTSATGVDNFSWGDDAEYDPANLTVYDGNWHFVAVTYDNTTRNRFVYIDPATSGLPVYQSNPQGILNVQPTAFTVGTTCCGTDFVGEISQLKVYNYALSAAQINGLDNGAKVGTNAILVTSAAGSSSVVLSDQAAWTAVSNSSFLHIAAGSASGTGSAVVAFTYDAFTGTGTRSGTLTIAGLTVTLTQTGTNYIGPGGLATLVSAGLNTPRATAVDASGNVYFADGGNNAIKEFNASTQQVTTLVSSGLNNPYGVAVDSSGNLYIADTNNNAIEEFNASTQQLTTLVSSGLSTPIAVAVDGSGNVYIVDDGNNAIKEFNPSTQQVTTLVSGLSNPKGVAVDAAGNVYISDTGNGLLKEWSPSTQMVTTLGSVSGPQTIAVDGSGNVYATANGQSIVEWSPSTQQFTTLVSGLANPIGVAVDGSGNVYIGNTGDNSIGEIPFAFVGPGAGLSETFAAGTDSLLPVIPSTQSLTGIYAPTSDQSWLTIGTISGGIVSFSFTQNNTALARTANITILGQQIPVTQQAPPPPPPALSCSNNATPPEVNVAYTTTCTVISGTGTPPFTWSIASGALPAGITSSTTAASITLTGVATVAGAAAYTIQLSDSAGGAATQAFSGTIVSAAAFTCSNNNVPTQTGVPYTTTCTVASGTGVSPFTWSISAGALPAGVTSATTATSITLTGPATMADPAAYTIQLTDQFGVTAMQAFSGTIAGSIIANWSFANGSNLGADSSGNGYNLIQEGNGPITFDPTALGGQGAAVFNGSDYFDFGGVFPPLLPTGSSSYTIAAWINPAMISPSSYGIVGWGAYGNGDQVNAFRTTGATGVDNYSWGDDAEYDPPNFTVYDGNWHFVAVTYDNTTQNRFIYIDPAASGPPVFQSNPRNILNVQPTTFRVGITCCSEFFVGEISQLKVYNYALSPAQINGLDNATKVGTNAILVTSAGGSSSVMLSVTGAWTAASNSSFLHIASGSASGTGSAVVAFTYDAFTGTGTRSGTLTVAGLTVTVTQTGTNYTGPGGLTTLVSSGLNTPIGVAVDASGNVYFADNGNNAVKEFNASTQQVTTLVSSGLNSPNGVAVDSSGNVYIADTGNSAIEEFNESTGQVTALVSSGLSSPVGVAVDGSGNVYIADAGSNTIEEFNASTQQVTTLVSAGLSNPRSVAVDFLGNVYIADLGDNQVKEFNPSTQQLTELASVIDPQMVAVDGSGSVYTTAYGRFIAKQSQVTQQVTILASGLNNPAGFAVDGSGNVYVADTGNNAIREIPFAFVGPAAGLSESFAAGTDSLLPVIPPSQSLTGVLAPASNQNWLTIGPISGGVVGFSFTQNTTASARTANITILGQQIPVTQQAPPPPAFTCSNNSTPPEVNIAYTTTCMVTSGTGTPPFTWSIAAGALPAGVTSSTTATSITLGGAATVAGNTAYTIQLNDSASGVATQAFSGTIAPAAAFTCSNNSVPVATNAPYTSTCTVTSGTGVSPFTFSISAGALPAGVTSATTATSITLNGPATMADPAGYTIQLTDQAGVTATQAFSGIIAGTLVANWSFSNGANLGADSSGNGYNLIQEGNGPITFDPAALGGQGAAVFNGSDYFDFGGVFPALVPTGSSSYTIAAWINLGMISPGSYGIIGWGVYGNTDQTNAFRTDSTGVDNLVWNDDAIYEPPNFTLYDGKWHFVAVTYDNTTNNRFVYIDPASGLPAFQSNPHGILNVQPTAFTVGTSCCGTNFVGEISQLQVYNYALSPAQINGLDNPPTVGTSAILVTSAAGSSSVVLSDQAAWTAVSNSSFLHIAPGSASGTGSSVVLFTYDAFTSTGTRSGTLTVAGLTVTVTQTGANYIGPGALTTLLSSGLNNPAGVAVDTSGNIYFADAGNNAIKEFNASTQQVTTLVSPAGNGGLNNPYGVAVDGSGNVYIADAGNNAIKEFNVSTQQVTTLVSTGLSSPVAVALDASGNVYIVDDGNNAIKEYSPSTQQVTTLVSAGLFNPKGVAVDAAGNVYISDSSDLAIKEWIASTQTVITLGSVGYPQTIAVDGSGNVYASTLSGIVEWNASTQQFTTLASGLNSAIGVAVDGSGNVYVGDTGDNLIGEIPFAFVGPGTGLSEPFTAGTDSLLPVVPPTQSLTGVFAPASDQTWLTIGTISGGVVPFSFTTNNTGSARTANIMILGQQIPVTQQAPPAFTCTNSGTPPEVSVAYTTTCTVISGTGTPPFTWSVGAGALPAGVTSNATATSITLTGAATIAGNAAYTIQVTDSAAAAATQAFSGTIAPAAAFTCSNNSVPAMTSAPYTTTCTETSGTGVSPFTFSISAGALPAGVTSATTPTSITLSGPATMADPAAYTIQLTDQLGVTAMQPFSGTIAGSIIANWSFSNGSNLGADSSGNGYNLIQEGNGPITFDPTALGGQGAAVFNGSDYFDFGGVFPPLLPTGNSSYTIAAWINPGMISPSSYGIIGWGAYGNTDQTNAFRTTGSSGVVNYSWNDDAEYDPPNFTVYDGNWHFVAATYDNTTRNRFVYIDPATSSLPAFQSNPQNVLNVQPTTFRVGITCCSEFFVGEISQLQVFNYALSPAQINSLDDAPSVGTNAITVTSAAGSSSVVLSDQGAWTATSNASFLHIAAGSASGTGSALVAFTYDAFTGTGTRSGTLTVAGNTVTVTQTGTNYIGPGGLTTLVSAGLNTPRATAVDASGNVYFVDGGNNAIKEFNASTQQVTTLVSPAGIGGLNNPYGVAVDSSGNVYIADTNNNAIEEFNASTQQLTSLVSSGLSTPIAVAVDGSGNVYIVDDGNNAIKEFNPSTQQVTTLVSGLSNPKGVAVDVAGNVYISDTGNGLLKEWSPSTQMVTTLGSVSGPQTIAVDGSGNVYATANGQSIVEWSPSTQQFTTLVSGLANPIGVAVDGSGNVYIGDTGDNSISEIPFAFVGPSAGLSETFAAGTDSLLPVIPPTQPLTGVFAPVSDQSWLTIGAISGGIVPFSFTLNNTGSARTANITILGQQIPVIQQAASALTITTTTLPNGAFNQPYGPVTLAAGGGSGVAANYLWKSTTLPAGLSISAMGTITGTPTAGGNYTGVMITVADSTTGQLASQTFTISISYPVLTITTSSALPSGTRGMTYPGVTLAATGGSGVPANYQWTSTTLPAGLSIGLTTGTISGAPATAGNYAGVAITLNDTVSGQSATKTFTINIGYPALSITTPSLPSGQLGQSYSAALSATGGSGGYVWSSGALPAGLTLAPAGSITGTPTAPSSVQVSFTVTDQTAGQSAATSLALTITAPPLVITGSGTGDVASGGSLTLSFNASGGAPPYQWALSGAPGFSVDGSGNVTGTGSQPGSLTAKLTVTDSVGTSMSLPLTIAVLGINGSFPAGTTTSAYSGSATGVGGVPPYSYTASGVPPGMSFSGGTLSGQPQAPGSYSIGVQVTDSKGVTASGNYPFSITGQAPATLTISTTSLPDGLVGQAYSQSLGAAGGTSPYTWSQTGGQLPTGLSLNSGGGILGTPTATGAYSFGVQVKDSAGSQVVGTVSINIDPQPLTITNGAAFPSGQVSVDYPAQILTASGGTPPYTFGVSGTLPAGLTLDNGQIDGTPSAVGDFSFTLTVADSASPPATAKLGVSAEIDPNTPGLTLSTATASFSLAAGATAVPSPSTILVSATVESDTISFTTSSSVPWLMAGGSSGTPGSITVGPNSAALALSASGSPYSGTVTVTCTTAACTSKPQTIAVTLTLTSSPPQLTLGSPLLAFQAQASNPQASTLSLNIVNAGGGSLAIQSVSAADPWISVGAFPASVAPGPGVAVSITANPTGLNAGYYLSSLTVTSSAGSLTIPVTLLIAGAPFLTLGPAGSQFSLPQGGALGDPNGSFLVSISSGSTSFTASVLPGTPWLSGGGAGNASAENPGTVSFSIDQSALGGLAVGAYYGTIQVSGPGISNSPQDFQVILNVTKATARVVPDPQPAGLIFIGPSGPALPPQTIQLFASSKTSLAYQASASATDGSGWLAVSPATGSTSAASPAAVTVTASPAGLAPGVYRGTVSFSFASAVRSVNVTLIVEGTAAASSSSQTKPSPRGIAVNGAAACADAQLVPTQTGLVSNFSAPAAWPIPLQITLVDTCGNSVANGQLIASFSNGDPPLILAATDPANGLYSATWTPRATAAQIAVKASVSAPGYTTTNVEIAGQVAPNTAPVLSANGTLDVFNPQVGAGVGPGNIVQIYGSGLASQPNAPATLPLPTQVNGTMVIIGGEEAPLYYVSGTQINAQIPFDLAAGNQYQVIVSANGALTTPQPIQLTTAVPAVLQFTSGAVEAQHADGTLVSDTSPAVPGEYLVIYLTGLGATDIAVPSGAPSPSDPPANVLDTPVLTLSGTQVPVLFAGLTPGLVGLYQVNFQIPATFATGSYTLVITQSGTASNQTILSVQQPPQN